MEVNKEMKYRESKLIMLVMITTLALILITPVQAVRPRVGTMELTFNLAWSGPSETIPEWEGTITIENSVYNMKFYNLASRQTGNTLHFKEIWKIYDGETLVLLGTDEGVVSLSNSKYRMNGEVTEAYGDFSILRYCNVHMSGDITWQNLGTSEDPIMAPETAPGIFILMCSRIR